VVCLVNDTHLMVLSSHQLSIVICYSGIAQSVDANACFILCINAQLLNVSMALAANNLCISVVL